MRWRTRGTLGRTLALLLVGGAVFLTVLMMENSGNVVRGVSAGTINAEKLTYEELARELQDEARRFENAQLALVLPDGSIRQAIAYQLGVSMNATATLEHTYDVGRGASFLSDLASQVRAFITGTRVPFAHSIDRRAAEEFVENQLAAYHAPAQEIAPRYNTEKDIFLLADRRQGRILDIDALVENLAYRAARADETTPIALIQHDDMPTVTTDGAQEAYAQAQTLLAKHPFTLAYEDESFEIEKEDWLSWLVFESNEEDPAHLDLAFSQEAIEEYLVRFAPGINKAPINAEFSLQEGRATAFALARPGRELMIEESTRIITQQLTLFARGELPSVISLVLRELQPAITSEKVNDLGITSLLGSGASDFAGSPQSRAQNIRVGSDKFQGAIVAPGEEFSFNQLLGNVTAKEGYVPELVIKKNKTVPEYGGGLCQVSTTLFRAAVYAGLEITQRTNHSYPVVYYGTPGFDATIYPPNPNLKFRNTTQNHILLQYRIDSTQLTWEIYGTDDGRTVELDGPHTYDKKPDGSMKAWLTQTVRDKEGNVINEKTFYSNYKSPALYPVDRNPLE